MAVRKRPLAMVLTDKVNKLQRHNQKLKTKLAEAEWLIRELDVHCGAEGWSDYLIKRLDQYKFMTPGKGG